MAHLCRHCGGSGQANCPRCGGNGEIKKEKCYHCQGKCFLLCPVCRGYKYMDAWKEPSKFKCRKCRYEERRLLPSHVKKPETPCPRCGGQMEIKP